MKRLISIMLMTIVCYGCFLDSLWSDKDDEFDRKENQETTYRYLQPAEKN